jgi:opacity protein-like surface antigen
MKNIKRIVIAATLLLSLVGGASQASADPGTPPSITAGVSWEGFGIELTAGVTWED